VTHVVVVPKPTKVIGVGRNYLAHARELGGDVPEQPIIFLKPLTALLGQGDAIVLPRISHHVEFEGEIGVVIGKTARHLTVDAAMDAVAGFTCVNDVTARDLQKLDGQWTRSKSFDATCPIGPAVVGGLDWRALEVVCRVNGVERQRAPASAMAFSIPVLVAFASSVMTLEPGDVIATGTPAGTAALQAGDVVEVEIPGVGILRNPVVAEP
jgi:2-keto-4-pentenoate hydratase/2-oxohepta-3-ene-1,7-dioic acid hydratase in catechol pathway